MGILQRDVDTGDSSISFFIIVFNSNDNDDGFAKKLGWRCNRLFGMGGGKQKMVEDKRYKYYYVEKYS
jgi:hypothetical protein